MRGAQLDYANCVVALCSDAKDRSSLAAPYLDALPDRSIVPEGAFKGRSDVVSAQINEGVRLVDHSAFRHCRHLASVSIPSTVSEIGPFCFEQCLSLQEVRLPEALSGLGHSCFRNCRGISQVHLPNAIEAIPMGAFSGCSRLADIVFPDALRAIGTWALSCTAFESIQLPLGLEVLGQGAFCSCSLLRSVTVPPSVKSIGEKCFASCGALYDVHLGEGLQAIGQYAFGDCPSLRFLSVPSTVRTFDRWLGYKPQQTAMFAPGISLDDVDSLRYAFSLALGFIEQDSRVGVEDSVLWDRYRPFIQGHLLELCRTVRYEAQLVRWLLENNFVTCEIFDSMLEECMQGGYIAGTAELLECAADYGHASSRESYAFDRDDSSDFSFVSAGLEL